MVRKTLVAAISALAMAAAVVLPTAPALAGGGFHDGGWHGGYWNNGWWGPAVAGRADRSGYRNLPLLGRRRLWRLLAGSPDLRRLWQFPRPAVRQRLPITNCVTL
jgi:hypothetical protein